MRRYRVEAVSLGELALLVGLTHQALLAVHEVRRCCACLFHALGDSSAKWVIPVVGLQCWAALPLVGALILREPLGRVVTVVLCPLAAGFLLRVPLRRVSHAGVHGRRLIERNRPRVVGELVVLVVAPGARLVAA